MRVNLILGTIIDYQKTDARFNHELAAATRNENTIQAASEDILNFQFATSSPWKSMGDLPFRA